MNHVEAEHWDRIFAKEDPWNYGSAYEQTKYRHTLEMLPKVRPARAAELACAEGMFTRMLAERVDQLLAVDISALALERAERRCADLGNVVFERRDLGESPPAGPFDLVVCSEVLYYMEDEFALRRFAGQLAQSLSPGGHLVATHANAVSDDRESTGFDFAEFGAKFIGQVLSEQPWLEFVRELRTPIYRVQVFRRRFAPVAPGSASNAPLEVLDREARCDHPMLKLGGCAVIDAEARYLFATHDVPILMYHRVADDGPPELSPYRIEPSRFEQQLRYLHRHGYRTTTVGAVQRSKACGAAPASGRLVALTFDDAYLDFAETAWPLLRRYGFAATVYVPTNHVGGRATWDSEVGDPAPLMSWEQVQDLAAQGCSFGAHGASHRRLVGLSPEDLQHEVMQSRTALLSRLGREPDGFSYPYGDFDPAVEAAVRAGGFDHAVGVVRDTVPGERFRLRRTEIEGHDTLDDFIAKLPPASPAPADRQLEYQRLRAVRSRRTYF